MSRDIYAGVDFRSKVEGPLISETGYTVLDQANSFSKTSEQLRAEVAALRALNTAVEVAEHGLDYSSPSAMTEAARGQG